MQKQGVKIYCDVPAMPGSIFYALVKSPSFHFYLSELKPVSVKFFGQMWSCLSVRIDIAGGPPGWHATISVAHMYMKVVLLKMLKSIARLLRQVNGTSVKRFS